MRILLRRRIAPMGPLSSENKRARTDKANRVKRSRKKAEKAAGQKVDRQRSDRAFSRGLGPKRGPYKKVAEHAACRAWLEFMVGRPAPLEPASPPG